MDLNKIVDYAGFYESFVIGVPCILFGLIIMYASFNFKDVNGKPIPTNWNIVTAGFIIAFFGVLIIYLACKFEPFADFLGVWGLMNIGSHIMGGQSHRVGIGRRR